MAFYLLLISMIISGTSGYQLVELHRYERNLSSLFLNDVVISALMNNSLHMLRMEDNVDLTNFQSVQYFGIATVGTPAQVFTVLFDTGSDIFWIPGPNDNSNCGSGHRRFKPDESSSYIDLNKRMNMNYLKGRSILNLVKETVTIGRLSVKNQVMGLTEEGECSGTQFDGIMGMSLRIRNRYGNVVPVFDSMIDQKLVNQPIFSFYLNRESENGRGGELYLGGINPEYVKGQDIKYLPVVNQEQHPYWMIQLDSVSVGGMGERNALGILDTGTSLIVAPSAKIAIVATAWSAQIVQGVLVILCDQAHKLPPLVFTINGVPYEFSVESLIWMRQQGYCMLGVGIGDVGYGAWLLGDFFLRRFYSIHNYSKKSVALVPISSSPSGGSSSPPTVVPGLTTDPPYQPTNNNTDIPHPSGSPIGRTWITWLIIQSSLILYFIK